MPDSPISGPLFLILWDFPTVGFGHIAGRCHSNEVGPTPLPKQSLRKRCSRRCWKELNPFRSGLPDRRKPLRGSAGLDFFSGIIICAPVRRSRHAYLDDETA